MRNMFTFFYDIALHGYALWGALYTLYKKKSWKSIVGRLSLPDLALKRKGAVVWVHAVSFGEMKAAAALITRLLEEGTTVLLSTCSMTGYAEAQKWKDRGVHSFFLPFDFSYLIRPFVKKVRPTLLVIIENDLWRNLIKNVKEVGGKVFIINGKISDRSFRRLHAFPKITKELYGRVDFFALQSALYQERFLKLALDPSKMEVLGNIKLDSPMPKLTEEEKRKYKTLYGIEEGDFVYTLASTHHPEESLWLEALTNIRERYPQLKLFIVPRHTERADAIASLLEGQKIAFSRSSEKGSFLSGNVILVDQMGILLRLYQLSHLAFVGGSFIKKVGGHNIIEPASYGIPTLYGPYMQGQPTFASLMEEYKAGVQLEEERMSAIVEEFFIDSEKRERYGKQGERLASESRGAFEKSWNKMREFLPIKG